MDSMSTPAPKPLPLWNCHKQVRAARINAIDQAPAEDERQFAGGDWILRLDGGWNIRVGHEQFVLKHRPEVGGFYVQYADGYQSYSPAKAFEEGYTPVVEDAVEGRWKFMVLESRDQPGHFSRYFGGSLPAAGERLELVCGGCVVHPNGDETLTLELRRSGQTA